MESPAAFRVIHTCSLALLLLPPLQLACDGGTVLAPEPDAEPPPDTRALSYSECPSEAITAGAACSQPEGTVCQSGACGELWLQCRQGVWRASTALQPPLQCPMRAPQDGEACPPCFPQTLLCGYGCLDPSAEAQSARCVDDGAGSAIWRVSARDCPDADLADIGDADSEDADVDASDEDADVDVGD